MKLAVVGATGGIGRQLLQQAVGAGHDVTAVVRDPTKLTGAVPFVEADLSSAAPAALEPALEGADAVLSSLGARSKAEADITPKGTRTVLEAMQRTGVRRIVAISAAPVSTVASPGRPNPAKFDPGDGFLTRHLLSPIVKGVFGWTYAQLALMEDLLRDSEVDWTIIRPPRLTDKPLSGSYRTALGQNVRGGASISRADVAEVMLKVLERPETIKTTVGVAY